jgi:hypothetical protein
MPDRLSSQVRDHRDSDLACLYGLLARWQRLIGMERWEIHLTVESDIEEAAFMTVERQTSYQRAVIKISPDLLAGRTTPEQIAIPITPERIEQCLVHELLHCLATDLISIFHDDLNGHLHPDAYDLIMAGAKRAEEHLVDTLATRLVEMRQMIDREGAYAEL